ncbi:hypothetical protein [Nocardia wallacei]|uniref:hypothetical protein n=1 Tax=Nocardia wallacei TaxID=480035 RepID=UPI00245498B4|nr:hypothetical protein [Nocardia wallacei]
MRIGSLFSGAGMLDVAALQLFPGAAVAWHCETDPAAARVLAHHWPDVPTPSAAESTGGGQHPDRREGHSRQLIDFALLHESPRWGEYEAAIRRQEALSRPAPSPTEPNSNGRPRLAARFAEWMMFWPAGWVTDPEIGLSRADQLRIIGNGVVPPQALAAFWHLLAVSLSAEGASD